MMQISHTNKQQHAPRPEVFWQWAVSLFLGMFVASVLLGVWIFQDTKQFIDTAPEIDAKNTEQQIQRLEKRIEKIKTVVGGRVGQPEVVPTSQN